MIFNKGFLSKFIFIEAYNVNQGEPLKSNRKYDLKENKLLL